MVQRMIIQLNAKSEASGSHGMEGKTHQNTQDIEKKSMMEEPRQVGWKEKNAGRSPRFDVVLLRAC